MLLLISNATDQSYVEHAPVDHLQLPATFSEPSFVDTAAAWSPCGPAEEEAEQE